MNDTLASALANFFLRPVASLPVTDRKAVALVTAAANSQHVDATKARRVYRRAPYGTLFLRYLYTVGWMSGTRNRAWCALDRVTGADPTRDVDKLIRNNKKLLARLRGAHVPVAVASAAVGKGFVSECGK
ncbi:MAG: hypothetical protein WCJ67_12010 [Thermoleophilia bacterium]